MIHETTRREARDVVDFLSVHQLAGVADVVSRVLKKCRKPGIVVPEFVELRPASVRGSDVGDVGIVSRLASKESRTRGAA